MTGLQDIKKWFYGITAHYDGDMVLEKIKHCENVSKTCREIAKQIKLDPELASICGLVHDVGRFQQISEHKTMSDKEHDHASMGCRMFDYFWGSSGNRDNTTIYYCILMHNVLNLKKYFDFSRDPYIQLVRDADKLDILRLTKELESNGKLEEIAKISFDINPELSDGKALKQFLNREVVSKDNIHSIDDYKLMVQSFVFDLNYEPSILMWHKMNRK